MAILSHKDRVKQAVSVGGVGALTLGAAASGYQALGASDNGLIFPYIIEDGATWETGYGTYTHTGTSFARTTRHASSSGAALTVTTSAYVMIGGTAELGKEFTDFRAVFGQDEISVTTTATATISRMHVCSGTTADYTVTLPTAIGNAGKFIGVRMATGLTKLVTLDGNGTETIDGSLTRVMWAGESAILLSDGANWFKVAGKSLPMVCTMHQVGGDQTFTSGVVSKVTGLTVLSENVAMGNVASSRIDFKRPAAYVVSGCASFANFSAQSARALVQAKITGAFLWNAEAPALSSSSTSPFGVKTKAGILVGDYAELFGYQNSGANQVTDGTNGVTFISAVEILAW